MRYNSTRMIQEKVDKMATQMVHARVDVNIKQEAERIFEILGINTSDAIRMFLIQVTIHNWVDSNATQTHAAHAPPQKIA